MKMTEITYSQSHTLACPDCGATFEADVWLIIDVAERPDLVEIIKDGTVHEISCPQCGASTEIDAPLLLFFAETEPHLIFSPAQSTTGEEDHEHVRALITHLRESLGPAWCDEWLAKELRDIPRTLLPLVLAEGLDTVEHEEPEQSELQLLPEMLEVLEELAHSGVEIRSEEDLRRALEARPNLLEKLMQVMQGSQSGPAIPAEFKEDIQTAQESEQRFLRNGDWEDLNRAVEAWRRILGHPSFPQAPERFRLWVLNDAGVVFLERYWRAGSMQDLGFALQCFQQAVEATPPDSPERPDYLNNLGSGLSNRYALTGRMEDLEEAISVWKQAVEATPPNSPDRPSFLNNLGAGLRDRYASSGRLDDLEEAIRICKQAVETTPQDSPNRSMYLNNLGAGLRDLYMHIGRMEDLEEAIRLCKQAVEATPQDSPNRPGNLSNLGNGLSNRYSRTGRINDLEEAIRISQQAVDSTPPDSPNRSMYLANLGNRLRDRYARIGRMDDLEKAIRIYQQAVEATPQDSPDRPRHLNNLGNGLRNRYEHTGRLENLREAQDHFRQACVLGEQHALAVMLAAGRTWGHWAFERQAWEEAVEAYDYAYRAMERLFRAQFSRSGKTSWIGEMRGVPTLGAFVYWKTGQPEQAVEALEAGRARLLGEAMERQRRDLENLSSLGRAELLERYHHVAEHYEALQRQGGDSTGLMEQTTAQRPADWLVQMEAALAELDVVIADIQQVPGYKTFLKPLTAGQIRAMASDLGAPLVYLAATPAGGLAFIVTQQGVQALELPELTEGALKKRVSNEEGEDAYLRDYLEWRSNLHERDKEKRWQATLDATCTWLGRAVMGPLVAALREVAPPEGQVILIPSDMLSLLPLHAAKLPASDAGKAETYALDHYAFTYAPSAQALHHAKEKSRSASAETLVAVEDPRGDLPYTPDEVQAIRAHFGERVQHLPAQQATREAVRAAFPAANVLHFSTHGMAGWGDAQSARLLLADGDLTLREVYDLKLDRARLAVLSACETAIPGLENPDEMIALPSGWMQAGVPGVVGTLWAVNDLSTAMLIARFYDLWRQQGQPLPQALRQAQRWLRDIHQDEAALAELHTMAEQARLRMPAQQAKAFLPQALLRDFSHPFYWAPFTFTGI